MVEKQISIGWSYGSLLTTLALAVFVFVLVFLFNVSPVYAPDDPVRDGGSGGGGGPPPSNCIRGYVYDYDDGYTPVSGIKVYLNLGPGAAETTTSASGYFRFDTSLIYPNTGYRITVNGQDYDLSLGSWWEGWPYDHHWGQRATSVVTDNKGYAYKTIYLQRAAEPLVTFAALFSNSRYATLYYGRETFSTFAHTSSFSVAGTGASIGYSTSKSASRTFWVYPLVKACVKRPYYANTYRDDVWEVVKTGMTEPDEIIDIGTYATKEYKDPYSLEMGSYRDFQLINGTGVYDEYVESGSHTWSLSLGIDFSISYMAFGIPINLDTTVTSTQGTTNWVSYKVDNTSGTTLKFRVWTAGTFLDAERKIGGMELHIWEIT